MKLQNIYGINKKLKQWRTRGSSCQKQCATELASLGIKEALKNNQSILVGGKLDVGDGSLGLECEIHILIREELWSEKIGALLTHLLVKKYRTVNVELYKSYVDMKFVGDSGIHYIIRLCNESSAPKAWWIFGYLMNEAILAPERIKIIKKWLDCGIELSDAFTLGMQELKEEKLWNDLGSFVIDYNIEECKKIIEFKKGDYGWKRREEVLGIIG